MPRLHPFKYTPFICLLFSLIGANANAESDAEIHQRFNQRYHEFLSVNSQIQLPFNRIDKESWKKLFAGKEFRPVFTAPNQFYTNKTFTFNLYQAADNGAYYLDAIGGFWGMEELVYGPISETELK